jgi:UDP-N-acetylmuramoyl-tripeptide--D-alanyl-D-alanine ligase
MNWLNLSQIAAMTNGTLHGEDRAIDAVFIDSRKADLAHLFIAIKGDRFDAHDFVTDLAGKAGGAMVDHLLDCDLPQIVVKDTRQGLADLSAAWRKQFTKPVIGLTGSNGKTTVKEMVSSILSCQGNVLATLGNLNNDIGMPLTLLRIRDEHDFAVIEVGANHFKEIDFLTHIATPDVALINNAGPAHLEGFGDVAGVAKAKAEIFHGLSKNGTAIINADDDYAEYWKGLDIPAKLISFGLEKPADISGVLNDDGSLAIKFNDERVTVNMPLPGKHNALNALAATAVATTLGITLSTVKQGLELLQTVKGRLAIIEGRDGLKVIDDTYNANPASAHAAVKVLAAMGGKRILVMGDMGELGDDAGQLHAALGQQAKQAGIDGLYCYGKYSISTCEEFGNSAHAFDDMNELIATLNKDVSGDMTILVKGSRSMRMERVVEALVNNVSDDEASSHQGDV